MSRVASSRVGSIGNISCSAGSGFLVLAALLSAAATISVTHSSAQARSTQGSGLSQHLARFNFTGTFRFKPKSPQDQPIHNHRSPLRVIVAATMPEATTPKVGAIKTRTSRPALPLKVIATENKPSATQRKPDANAAIQTAAAPIENSVKENTVKNHRDIKPATTPISALTKPGVTASQPDVTGQSKLPSKAQTSANPTATSTGSIPTKRASRPSLPATELAATVQPAAKPQPKKTPISTTVAEKSLPSSNRSALGAGNLATSAPPPATTTPPKENPASLVQAVKPADQKIAQPDTNSATTRIASAALEQRPSSAQQAPVTRTTRSSAIPPLPTKYRRPKTTAKRKQRPTTRRKVVKAAPTKKKSRSKSKPASSNWLSSAPKWAGGAFKTD